MRDLHGVNLSEGAIASILQHAGEKAAPIAERLQASKATTPSGKDIVLIRA